MKTSLLITLLLSFSFLANAQFSKEEQHQIDSLNKIINNPSSADTALASAYVGLSEILYITNIDTLTYLCEISKEISEKALANKTNLDKNSILSFRKSLAASLNNIGYIYKHQGDIPKALEYYHKSLKIQEEIGAKKGIATSLNNIGMIYKNQGDIPKALEYYHKSLKIQEDIGFKEGIALSLNNIGSIYDSQGDISKALEYYYKSLKTREEIGNKQGIATSLNNIGSIYDSQGDIPKALEYYYKSLKIQEEIEDKEGIATSLNNIGIIYNKQGDITKALEYYHKSLKIQEEIEDKEGIARSLNNIGYIYKKQGDIPKALEYYHKSLKIQEEIGYKKGIALSLNNIGAIYNSQGDITKALEYYHKSLKIQEDIGDKDGIVTSLINIGNIELKQGKINSAKQKFTRAFEIANEIGYPEQISKSASYLSEIAIKQNNNKEAYNMYHLHIAMRDSINNEKTQKAAIQKAAKYNYEKQKALDDAETEKILAIKQKESEKQIAIEKEAKAKQRILIFSIAAGLLLVMGFLAFVYNRLRITKKQKVIIEKQKQQVEIAHKKTEQQKEIIEETHKEITDSINYAKRLQDAILPPFTEIDTHLPNNFVLFHPKDVVSGDFYWFESVVPTGSNQKPIALLAAADCTGHGVPGAMVSVVCSNALQRTVNEFNITAPAKILDKTRELVIETFAKSGEEVKDGMDIALCAFTDSKVIFSGANNPLWIVRNTKELTAAQLEHRSTCIIEDLALIEFKANKQPIGLYAGMQPFTQTEIDLKKGDTLYFFTDGFADQFGGEKGKKFKYKPFKRLLIEISTKPMQAQKEIIQTKFNNWMGEIEQVDDVCVIGVRI